MQLVRPLIVTWPGRAIVGVAVVAVVGGAVIAPRLGSGTPAAEVRTAAVARANVTQTVSVSGSVNAAAQVRLNFKTGGRLAELLVKVGQAVAAGQPLARLDLTDPGLALKQAEVNLASAQAKYEQTLAGATAEDIAIATASVDAAQRTYDNSQRATQNDLTTAQQALDNAKRSLEQTQRSTAGDLAAALQTLTRTKTGYVSARANFASLTAAITSDVAVFQKEIGATRARIAAILAGIDHPGSVISSLTSADNSLAVADTYAQVTLQGALDDYQRAVAALAAAASAFDGAVSANSDPATAASQYQTAHATYQVNASRLSAAIDVPSGQVTAALASVSTAQSTLNTSPSKDDGELAKARADIVPVQTSLTAEQQLASALKTKVAQAGTSVVTITDAVTGGYVSAQQAYAGAQAKADTAVQSAQNAVSSAQQSLASMQDKNAATLTSQENALRSAQLSFQKTTATPRSYDIATALASVQLQQIAVEKARNDLEAATLRAPSAGIVASIASQPGEFVSGGGATGFIVIANTSTLTLHGTVGEAEVAKLKLGQVATVTVDAVGAATRMTGKIAALDPIATIQQGVPVYGVDVQIDIADPAVRAGMSGTASVIVASKQSVLTVPNLAVRSQSGRRFVQVMREGKIQEAEVTFGLQTDSVTEVVAGLEEGEQVVLPQPRATTATQQIPQGAGVRLGGGAGGGPGQVPFR